MQLKGSLTCAQEPATSHYPHPDESGYITLHYIAFHCYITLQSFIHSFDPKLSPSSNTMWNNLYRYIKIHNIKYKVL